MLIPRCAGSASGSVLHSSATSPARRALVIQVLAPVTTHPSPSGRATVRLAWDRRAIHRCRPSLLLGRPQSPPRTYGPCGVARVTGVQSPSGPLSGIRVVELSSLGPGPYAGMLLAELGADVLRVDRPGATRLLPPEGETLHRSRPCAAVDLKSPEGRDVVLRLVGGADVLVEGLRPGVTERLGLGPE